MPVRNVTILEEDGIDTVGDLVTLTRASLVGDGTREGVLNLGVEAFEEACRVVAALGGMQRPLDTPFTPLVSSTDDEETGKSRVSGAASSPSAPG
jgi:hypothetical protein